MQATCRRLTALAAFCLGAFLIFLAQEGIYPASTLVLAVAGLLVMIGVWIMGVYRAVLAARSQDLQARRRSAAGLAMGLYCILGMAIPTLLLSKSRFGHDLGLVLGVSTVIVCLLWFWLEIRASNPGEV
jgi:hypothetical protein